MELTRIGLEIRKKSFDDTVLRVGFPYIIFSKMRRYFACYICGNPNSLTFKYFNEKCEYCELVITPDDDITITPLLSNPTITECSEFKEFVNLVEQTRQRYEDMGLIEINPKEVAHDET